MNSPVIKGQDSLDLIAREEAKRSEYDIYEEVFIDEVNAQLLESVEKANGDIVVVLMRQERLKKFAKLWKAQNLDYYTI